MLTRMKQEQVERVAMLIGRSDPIERINPDINRGKFPDDFDPDGIRGEWKKELIGQ